MSVVFTIILTLSITAICIFNPSVLLSAFSSASVKAIKLCATLVSIYAVWLGFTEIIKESGLSKKFSQALKPAIKKLFKTTNQNAIESISLSVSCNVLGLSGVATPTAIDGMKFLDDDQNEYGKTMLFVISATSLQILPITVLQLLTEYGALTPTSVILPSVISTFVSTLLGIFMVKIFV